MNNNKKDPCDYLIKLLLIGDSSVGKSSLMLRYTDDTFSPNMITTIGIDFKIRSVELDGKRIKLQIWDTAGQEQYRVMTNAFYRGAMGIFLVYDVTNEASFRNIQSWMVNLEQHASEGVLKMLMGNKCDIPDEREIDTARGQAWANQHGLKFFETSAKTGKGVDDAFLSIAREIKRKLDIEDSDTHPVVPYGVPPLSPASKPCCSLLWADGSGEDAVGHRCWTK